MAEQDNVGAPGPTGRRQWLRRAALAFGLAGTLLAAVPAAAAHASSGPTPAPAAAASGPDGCGDWYPASGVQRTSNNLLGVYLQARNCPYGRYIRVAVRNFSTSGGVGTRTYGLYSCYSTGTPGVLKKLLETFEGVYIPANDAWASQPVWVGGEDVSGTINRPRAYPGAFPEIETRTNCA